MLADVIGAVLTIVIGALLKIVLQAIGVEIDSTLFNTIVAGIVLWILRKTGLGLIEALMPKSIYRLKERNLWRSE